MVLCVVCERLGCRCFTVMGLDGFGVQIRYGNVILWLWTGFYPTSFAMLCPRPANEYTERTSLWPNQNQNQDKSHAADQDEDAGNNMRVKEMVEAWGRGWKDCGFSLREWCGRDLGRVISA